MQEIPRTEAETNQWPILDPIAGPRERAVALGRPVCLAGARVKVHLPLPANEVSRAHALLLSDEHGVYLRDLASLNHVYVNDAPVREATLDNGDVLRIGPFTFRCERGFRRNGAADEQAAAMQLSVEGTNTRVALSGRTCLIGRREGCDLLVADPMASPAHAVVFEQGGRHFLRDLRTQHGTYVNDTQVGQAELQPGDRIRIGSTHLRYEPATTDEEAGAVAAAPAPEATEAELNLTPETEDPEATAPEGQLAAEEPLDLDQIAREFQDDADDAGTIPLLEEPAPRPGSGAQKVREVSQSPTGADADESAGASMDEDEILRLLDEPRQPAPAAPAPVDQTDGAPIIPLRDEQEEISDLLSAQHSAAGLAALEDLPVEELADAPVPDDHPGQPERPTDSRKAPDRQPSTSRKTPRATR